MKRHRLNLLLLLIACSVLGISHPAWAPSHPAEIVGIENFSFKPATITLDVGTTVSWINRDSAPHTVTSSDRTLDSPTLKQGESFQFTFNTPGTYDYFCRIHPSMKARVVVMGGAPSGVAQYDANGNSVIDDSELFMAIDQWIAGTISNELFFQVIDAWISQAPIH
ncbi:MAG: hypothetical protein A2Z21_04320 [Candidatus Fraserbacteria bacterium RBG_16_55_9]|uniref:EfeO-type cupredoxin-like domain-containing protein n=1 Tax=Fraserbacteria sp. (strain RBG_16_55_9) TaxID=1817864 RepID=A0A1F5UP13_FRAXR|nr:MAG: hypothetical protein A2Z21_04320 [Candidatus Fraserbacteria bacterium RBG_16_55_9]